MNVIESPLLPLVIIGVAALVLYGYQIVTALWTLHRLKKERRERDRY